MRTIFLFAFILVCAYSKSQNQLKNIFSAATEIHGGAEGSGISRSETYVFTTNKTISIKGIYHNDKEIELRNGDTLNIHLNCYKAYDIKDTTTLDGGKNTDEASLKKRFLVVRKKKHLYHAWASYPYQWPKYVEYEYRNKTYRCPAKKEFDKVTKEYAP